VAQGEFFCERKISGTMRKSKISDEQIIGILRETPVKTFCTKYNVSEATIYKWCSNLGGMEVSAG